MTSQLSLLIITPNPALDRIMIVPGFRLGHAQRVSQSLVAAGGKGLNVARAARALGARPLVAAPLGGLTGQQVAQLASSERLELRSVSLAAETRVCVLVVDPSAAQVTVLNEHGPRLTATEWLAYATMARDTPAEWCLICGSIPPAVDPAALAELISALRADGRRVLVDTSGPALAAALAAQPDVIKVNGDELGEVLGMPISDLETARRAALTVQQRGIVTVVVTLGAAGAVGVDRAQQAYAEPPSVTVINPIGCGDSFFAGLATALSRQRPLAEAMRLATACGAADAQTIAPGQIDANTVRALSDQVAIRHE